VLLTLHYSPGACSLAPHILLHETGVAHQLVLTSSSDGTTKSPAWLAVNPKGRIPVLMVEAGGQQHMITEVPAVCSYIASLRPDLNLMGRDALEEARVLEWFNWLSGTMHGQGVAGVFRGYRFTDDEAAYEGIKAKAKLTLTDGHQQIEAKLKDRAWVCGDQFTAADTLLLFIWRISIRLGFAMTATYPAFTAWAKRMESRPSVAAMLRAEGISIWS
jgi:glutathione S-transferase